MTQSDYEFTSESVSEGHPDKVCDRISDTVVDMFLAADPMSRVACETLATTDKVILAGEVRGPASVTKDAIIEPRTSRFSCTSSRPTLPSVSMRPATRMRARATRASCSVTPAAKPRR